MTTNHPELKACELLPCPFCGGKPYVGERHFMREIIDDEIVNYYSVFCQSCQASSVDRTNKPAAIAAWQTRPSPIIPEDASGLTAPILNSGSEPKNKALLGASSTSSECPCMHWTPEHVEHVEAETKPLVEALCDEPVSDMEKGLITLADNGTMTRDVVGTLKDNQGR